MSTLDEDLAAIKITAGSAPRTATSSLDADMASLGGAAASLPYQNQPAVGLIRGVPHAPGQLAALQSANAGPMGPPAALAQPAWRQFLHEQAQHPERGGLIDPLVRGGAEAVTNAALSIPGAITSGLGGFVTGLGSPEQLNVPALGSAGTTAQRLGAAITPGQPSTVLGGLPAAAGNAVGQTFKLAGHGYQGLAEQAGFPRTGAVLGNVVSNLPTLAPVAEGARQFATQGAPALSRYQPPAVAGAPAAPAPVRGGVATPFTNPEKIVGSVAAQLLGSDAATLERLKNPEQFVPGSSPTSAQVVATPQSVIAEREYRGNPKYGNQFYAHDAANTSAQLAHIEQFGGTPEQIQGAITARSAAVSKWTDPKTGILNNAAPIDATGVIDALSKIEDSSGAIRPQVRGAISDINNVLKQRAQVDPQTGAMMVRPGDLDALRQNSGEFLRAHDPHGAVGSQANAIMAPMHKAIVDTLDSALPGYRDYLSTYAQQSVPINTMEAVNTFRDWAGGRPLAAGGPGGSVPQLNYLSTAAKIGQALEEGHGVSPEAQSALQAVQSDMQRGTVSNSVRSAGSDTAARLQAPGWLARQLYGEDFGGPGKLVQGAAGATGALISGPVGAGAGVMGIRKAAEAASSRVNSVMARALLDPKYAASIIEKYGIRKPGALANPSPANTALATGLLGAPAEPQQ